MVAIYTYSLPYHIAPPSHPTPLTDAGSHRGERPLAPPPPLPYTPISSQTLGTPRGGWMYYIYDQYTIPIRRDPTEDRGPQGQRLGLCSLSSLEADLLQGSDRDTDATPPPPPVGIHCSVPRTSRCPSRINAGSRLISVQNDAYGSVFRIRGGGRSGGGSMPRSETHNGDTDL